MSKVIKRNERITDLIKAQHAILAHVIRLDGTIRAKQGRELAEQLVANQSRRDSVWATLVNAGFLQPQGKGLYLITGAGRHMLQYWSLLYGLPDKLG